MQLIEISRKPACNAGSQQYTGSVTEEVSFFVICKSSVLFLSLLLCCVRVLLQTSAVVPAFFGIVTFGTRGLTFFSGTQSVKRSFDDTPVLLDGCYYVALALRQQNAAIMQNSE